MRNSAENKPFRIARYCSCPTFLHSREQGKVAACDIGRVAFAPRPRSPPLPIARKKEQVANEQMGRRRRKFELLAIGYRFLRSETSRFPSRREDRSFTVYTSSFCFSLVSFACGVPPPPSPSLRQCHFPQTGPPSQQESRGRESGSCIGKKRSITRLRNSFESFL